MKDQGFAEHRTLGDSIASREWLTKLLGMVKLVFSAPRQPTAVSRAALTNFYEAKRARKGHYAGNVTFEGEEGKPREEADDTTPATVTKAPDDEEDPFKEADDTTPATAAKALKPPTRKSSRLKRWIRDETPRPRTGALRGRRSAGAGAENVHT